ncbi:nuclear transport factor 2 family protein [Nocardia sp. NPDC050799]|uniref:nuclear transport factor 2 family protein n=1 Tax=Nocardia sp. NPDC050799 TaxID=3154842 RepID=UPI0033F5D8DD
MNDVPTADRVAEHPALQQTLARYCRAVDRMDLGLLRSCFEPGARLDFSGLFAGDIDGFTEWLGTNLRNYSFTVHTLSNTYLEVDGDQAAGECYVTALHGPALDGARGAFRSGGRYLDRFERRGDRWVITERTALVVWSEPAPDVNQPTAGGKYGATRSRRDHTDPSYALFAPQEVR